MNAPASAMCGLANKLIKKKWGFATASAPSNGSYMEYTRFKDEMWDFKSWAAVDSAVEALTAFYYHDMMFTGPMVGAPRVMPAIALSNAFLATAAFDETKELPKDPDHPINKLWPDFAENLKVRWQEAADLKKVER